MTEHDKKSIIEAVTELQNQEFYHDSDCPGCNSETIVLSLGYVDVWRDGAVTDNRKIIAQVTGDDTLVVY